MAFVVLALWVGVLGACSGGGDDASSAVLDIGSAEGETCLDIREPLPSEVEKLPTIDCAQLHTHEVFKTIEYEDDEGRSQTAVYPGVDALDDFAQAGCLSEFETFVGISAFDSSLYYSWLVPTLKSWQDHDDRQVLCVLGAAKKDTKLVGSMRGKKI